jgi:hypothetical protein
MRVKLLTSLAGPGGSAQRGELLDEERARTLGIRLDDLVPLYAEELVEEQTDPPAAEVAVPATVAETTAAEPEVETAARKRRR